MAHTYHELREYIAQGRSKIDRPLGHNRRVILRGQDVAIRYHSTDVVTYHPDSSMSLANGGWYTITTLKTIHEHGSRHVHSVGGDWFIDARPSPNDPEPEYRRRTIPKPYTMANPGPEPVKSAEGCLVGHREEYVVESIVPSYMLNGRDRSRLHVSKRPRFDNDPNPEHFHVAANHATEYVAERWVRFHAQNTTVKQCPHCREFEDRHALWSAQMLGHWHPSSKSNGVGRIRSYSEMCKMLERFGSRVGWELAYRTEFREVREHRQLCKLWRERNVIPWEVGRHYVDADGYVSRDVSDAWRRAVARRQREQARAAERERKLRENLRTVVHQRRLRRPNLPLIHQAIEQGVSA